MSRTPSELSPADRCWKGTPSGFPITERDIGILPLTVSFSGLQHSKFVPNIGAARTPVLQAILVATAQATKHVQEPLLTICRASACDHREQHRHLLVGRPKHLPEVLLGPARHRSIRDRRLAFVVEDLIHLLDVSLRNAGISGTTLQQGPHDLEELRQGHPLHSRTVPLVQLDFGRVHVMAKAAIGTKLAAAGGLVAYARASAEERMPFATTIAYLLRRLL